MLPSPAAAQDIRGWRRCTAETKMDRRTGCLQANVEFLQQALIKLIARNAGQDRATDRDLAAAGPRSPRSDRPWKSSTAS